MQINNTIYPVLSSHNSITQKITIIITSSITNKNYSITIKTKTITIISIIKMNTTNHNKT